MYGDQSGEFVCRYSQLLWSKGLRRSPCSSGVVFYWWLPECKDIACLPPMSPAWCQLWVEFLVGALLCFKGFSSGSLVFLACATDETKLWLSPCAKQLWNPCSGPPPVYQDFSMLHQGANKVIFTACHSGKLELTFTSPNIISTSPKSVLMSRSISQFFCNLNSSKNFTCLLGKLRTEFSSLIAKSTSPGLSDTTFFAHCTMIGLLKKLLSICHSVWKKIRNTLPVIRWFHLGPRTRILELLRRRF